MIKYIAFFYLSTGFFLSFRWIITGHAYSDLNNLYRVNDEASVIIDSMNALLGCEIVDWCWVIAWTIFYIFAWPRKILLKA